MARFKYAAIHATGAGPSFTNLDGATMDYLSTGIGFARFSASGATAGTSRGVKVRTLNAGTPVDAISAVADGTMTFAKGHIVTSGTTQMQAATCTTLAGTGAVSGFTTATFAGGVSTTGAAAAFNFNDRTTAATWGLSASAGVVSLFNPVRVENSITVTAASGLVTIAAGGLTVSAGTTAVQALTATTVTGTGTTSSFGNTAADPLVRIVRSDNGAGNVATLQLGTYNPSFFGFNAFIRGKQGAGIDQWTLELGGTAAVFLSLTTTSAVFGAGISCTTGTFSGAFGCNGNTAQTKAASGGTLAGVIAALVANGILSS